MARRPFLSRFDPRRRAAVGDEQDPAVEAPAESEQPTTEVHSEPQPGTPPPAAPEPTLPTIGPLDVSTRRGVTPPHLWPDPVRWFFAATLLLLAGAVGFAIGATALDGDDDSSAEAPIAPNIVIDTGGPAAEPEAPEEIGFPAFATRNTTRVGGPDSVATGAGVALASYPSLGGVSSPPAIVLAPADSWQEALAATPLTAPPIEAPVLLGDPDGVPELTAQALEGLAPEGLETLDGAQVLTVGDVADPEGFESLAIEGTDAAEVSRYVDAERAKLTGVDDPDHLLVVSSAEAAMAMPAASWAARSGDPILFADGDEVPEATLKVVSKHPNTPIYVLGPESAISKGALQALEKEGGTVTRIGEEDPVENAIAFARFVDGDFGWNINDPGHGFTIANLTRPLDAAVGAPLAAGGKPGPLLVTDDAEVVPPALQGFLADTQPGYLDDPSRAVYNHVWLLGDASAISVPFQAQVDELTKLAPVESGTGPELVPAPDEEPKDGGDGAKSAKDADDEPGAQR